MNVATYPVLELLAERDIALHESGMAVNLRLLMSDPPSDRSIGRTLGPLEERGLVERVDFATNYYVITDDGREYVDG